MSLIVRCPVCKSNSEMEESCLNSPTIECPSCKQVSYMEDFSVMTFCPHCHQKLAIPAEMINEEEILCVTCDQPFKPNSSFSLSQDELDEDDTIYQKAPEPQQLFQAGEYFDKYEIITLLGRGGMGEVYLAKHLLLNKKVAIKIMLAKNADKNPVAAKRFIREAKLANKIQSPNIIGVFDVGVEQKEKHLFIAMEYVDGLTLNQIMKERGTFTEQETLTIALDVCNALLIMEEHKIVHRDIKPSNIMINSEQVVKLADLGIAKVESSSIEGELTLTVDSVVFGTPNYASPEQCRSSHDTDTRSDIYSLGATMFHMVAGQPPFDGVTPMDTMFKVINEPPLDITTLNSHLSNRFKKLISWMLEKAPANRPQTIAELIQEINDILDHPEEIALPNNGPSVAEVTSSDYRTSLSSFLKKIDRFKTLTNFSTISSKINKGLKLFNLITKMVAVATIIVGVVTIIALIKGIKIDRDLLGFISSDKDNTDTAIKNKYKVNTSSAKVVRRPVSTPKKVNSPTTNQTTSSLTKNSTNNIVQPQTNTYKNTLSTEEFYEQYEKLFFADDSLSSPQAFSTIENRLNRSEKILSSPIIAKYKDTDKRFNDIYNYHLGVIIKLQKQFDTYKQRRMDNKKRIYSTEKTNQLVKLANELFSTTQRDWNYQSNLSNKIVSLLNDSEVNPNALITVPLKKCENIKFIKNPNIKSYINDKYLTIPLPEYILDDNVINTGYLYKVAQVILTREITPTYANSTYATNFLTVGINNLENKLVKTNSKYLIHDLLNNGDNPNQSDYKDNYFLHLATCHRDIELVKKALHNGVKINYIDKNGETALFYAERYSTTEIKNLLLSYGADPNIINYESKQASDYSDIGKFNTAVANNDYYQIKKTITPKLATLPLYNKLVPLFHAVNSCDLTLLEIVLNQNIDLNAQCPYYSSTESILEYIYNQRHNTRSNERQQKLEKILDILLKKGANPFFLHHNNYSPIIYYTRNNKNWFYKSLFNNIDLNIHLTNFFEYALLANKTQIISRYIERDAWNFFTVLVEKNHKINFETPEYQEKLPKLLGSLQVDERYLDLLAVKGYNLATTDSENKNIFEHFIHNLIKVYNLNESEIATIDHTLKTSNKLRKYYSKYIYLKRKGISFNEENILNKTNDEPTSKETSASSTNEKEENKTSSTAQSTTIYLEDIAKEEKQIKEEASSIEKFTQIHKDVFDQINHPDNFISTHARLARTKQILNNQSLLDEKAIYSNLAELYDFHKKVESRIQNQIRNKDNRDIEKGDMRYSYNDSNNLKLLIERSLKEIHSYSYDKRKNFHSTVVELLSQKSVNPYIKIHVPNHLYNRIKGNVHNRNIKGYLGLEVELPEAILSFTNDGYYWNLDIQKIMMRKKIIYPEKTPLYLLCLKEINSPEMCVDNLSNYLINAAKFNRFNELEFLIYSGDNVNQKDEDGNTVLHWLIRNNSSLIKAAIYAGAEINKPNKDGETPYFWAVRYGNVESRALLLRLGANPDYENKDGKKANFYNYITIFNNSLKNNDYGTIERLLKAYPSLANEFLSNRLSPVGFAIDNNNIEILKLLLKHKADPNVYYQNGRTSTLSRLWQRNISDNTMLRTFQLLLAYGADITFSRYPNTPPVIFELYQNPNRTYSETTIYNALVKNFNTQLHLVSLLEKIYYPFNSRFMYYRYYNPLHNRRNDVAYLLETLLKNSTKINNNNPKIAENIPKILGSLKLNLDVIEVLEKAGLDIKVTDSEGKNILDYFCMYFEKTYPNLRVLPTNYAKRPNRNHRIRYKNRFNSNTRMSIWDNYKEKVRYLRKKGLSIDKSLYDISDNIWNDWE